MIRKLMDDLSGLSSSASSLEMPVRLFQLICLTITVLTLFVILPINWFQNLPIFVNIADILLGMFAFFCFRESTRGRHHSSLFLMFMVLLMEPVWFLNSGTNGSIILYFLVLIIYPMMIFRGTKRWVWTACLTLNICALIAIDYFFPSLTVPFRSPSDRTLDLITGAFCSCLTLAMIVWMVISNYDRERERTEKYSQALAETHRRLATTVAAIPDLLFELDAQGHICEYHASVAELLYAPPEAFLGKTVEQVLPPEAAGIIRNALELAAIRGSHRGAVYTLDMHDGVRWFELSIAAKPEGSAPDARFVALARDITERVRAEEETQLMREELTLFSRVATVGELAASIAHDLNQPLASILNNARAAICLMQGASPDLKECGEILEDIVADDNRAAEMIRSMRTMLKREGGERLPLHLDDLIADVLSLVRNEAQVRNIAVTLDLDDPMPPISGERVQLQQVILNLIVNACEAMNGSDKHGKLVIRTRNSDGEVLVDVIDSGPGIPPDRLDAVFKPFFTTKKNGIGIGLSLSRTIVNAHGGRLWAENNAEKGATFHISLPVTGASAPLRGKICPGRELRQRSDPSGHSNPAKKIRVLLADDDLPFLERIADMLRKEPDMEIIGVANNGHEAAELAARLIPDIILMDIDMPKLNGIEATQVITKQHPDICIIALSMHEANERVQAMFDAGAASCLTKSGQPGQWINTIRRCVYTENEHESKRGQAHS